MPFKRKNSSVVHAFPLWCCCLWSDFFYSYERLWHFARAFDSETVNSATEMLFVDEKKKERASRFAVWLRTHQSSSANHMVLIITDYMMTHVTIGHWFEQLNCFICLLWAKELLLVFFWQTYY